MADYRLSLGIEEYGLFISNQDHEDGLEPDRVSSASDFSIIFNPAIDFNALLYLRAVQAQIACQDLCIDGLPLSLTRTETFKVFLKINETINDGNLNINSNKMRKKNELPLTLPISDVSSSDSKLVIETINRIFENDLNHFIFYRYTISFMDCNLFNDNFVTAPSEQDIELLDYYTNFILYSRYIIHQTLCKHAGITEDITSMIQLTSTRKKPLSLSREKESVILASSHLLRPLDQRKNVRNIENQQSINFIDLSLFYKVDVAKTSDRLNLIAGTIGSRVDDWLKAVEYIGSSSVVTEENKSQIRKLIEFNKSNIRMGLCARKIANLQLDKQSPRISKKSPRLFALDFFSISLQDGQEKCRFNINPNYYLADNNTSITIMMPPQVSYVLGSQPSENVKIGPITTNMTDETRPLMTATITNSSQELFCRVRPLPKVVYLISDLISCPSRDFWLKNSIEFSDWHPIYSQPLDESTIGQKFICKTTTDKHFLKLRNASSILDVFHVKLVDENFRQIIFSQRTYTRLSLVVRPAPIDHL